MDVLVPRKCTVMKEIKSVDIPPQVAACVQEINNSYNDNKTSSCICTGGYLADSISCFTGDGLFLLCPRATKISVLSALDGKFVGYISGDNFHSATIVAVDRFDLDDISQQYYASLDIESRICIWEIEINPLSDSERSYKSNMINMKLHSSFTIDSLQYPDQPSPILSNDNENSFSVPPRMRRNKVNGIHAVPGSIRSMSTARLILVVESVCTIKRKSIVMGLSDDSKTSDDLEEKENNLEEFVEVFALPLVDILKQNVVLNNHANLFPSFIFACLFQNQQNKKKNNRRSVIRSSISATGDFIAVAKDMTLCIWDSVSSNILIAKHTNIFSSIAFHPQCKSLVTGDTAGNVIWWYVLFPKLFSTGSSKNIIQDKQLNSMSQQGKGQLSKIQHQGNNNAVKGLRTKYIGEIIESQNSLLKVMQQLNIVSTELRLRLNKTVSVPVAIQHWHAHPVRALGFTSDGLHLISAGEEAVLVYWHISQTSRHFMPRFGAPIHTITSGVSALPTIAITLADNSIRLIDTSTSTVKGSFYSIQVPLSLLQGGTLMPIAMRVRKKDILPVRLLPFSSQYSNEALIVASGVTYEGIGANSRIQIYDLLQDKHITQLSVNQQNFVSRTDSNIKKFQWTIQNVAMSSNGKHLATIEFRRSMFPFQKDDLRNAQRKIDGSIGTTRGGITEHLDSIRNKTINPINPVLCSRDTKQDTVYESDTDMTQHLSKPTLLNESINSFLFEGEFNDHELESGRNYIIKFWNRQISDTFELMTEIEYPHLHDVTSVLSIPIDQNHTDFLTTSLDSYWKLWRLYTTDATSIYKCIFSASYRSLPCLSGSVSFDKSLLAIIHPGCISIWDIHRHQLIRTLGTPQSNSFIPIEGKVKLAWIETSRNKNGILQGDRLLLYAVENEIFLWDLKNTTPMLSWCQQFSDFSSIVLPDIWGLGLFGVVSLLHHTVDIYSVCRLDHEIECVKQSTISSFPELHPGLLFGCTFFGTPWKPYIGLLDSSFALHSYPLELNSYLNIMSEPFDISIKHQEETTTYPHDIHMQDPTISESLDKITDTNFYNSVISPFILKSRPTLMKSIHDPQQLIDILGQNRDGPSHLSFPPSSIFRNMISMYSPKYSNSIHVTI